MGKIESPHTDMGPGCTPEIPGEEDAPNHRRLGGSRRSRWPEPGEFRARGRRGRGSRAECTPPERGDHDHLHHAIEEQEQDGEAGEESAGVACPAWKLELPLAPWSLSGSPTAVGDVGSFRNWGLGRDLSRAIRSDQDEDDGRPPSSTIGRISTVPTRAPGIRPAMSTASSRLWASTKSNRRVVRFVSAKGPSVMSRFPPRDATLGGRRRQLAAGGARGTALGVQLLRQFDRLGRSSVPARLRSSRSRCRR